MPELPEVETVRRGLAPAMEGAVIAKLELNRPDLRFPLPENFAAAVRERRIVSLGRRAKYLLIDLEDDLTVISHLGMSGSFRIENETLGEFHHPRSKDQKHDHVVFHLKRDEGALRVIYNDPRRFGFMQLWKRSELDLYPAFAELGPEPTGNSLDADYLAGRLAGKSQPLKGALLDQTVIAGLGNIYVCEALWRSHLSPKRAAGSVVTKTGRPNKEPRPSQSVDPGRHRRCDRCRRLVSPGPYPDGWLARLFPALFLRLRPGRRGLPHARLRRYRRAHHPGGAFHILLPGLSEITCCHNRCRKHRGDTG